MHTKELVLSGELRIFQNHLYEFKRGVRNMILYTMSKKNEDFAIQRLQSQNIPYFKQDVTKTKINLYFGRQECLDAIKIFVTRPLNKLTPEEDFILGAMLGYDICMQCERFCKKKTT